MFNGKTINKVKKAHVMYSCIKINVRFLTSWKILINVFTAYNEIACPALPICICILLLKEAGGRRGPVKQVYFRIPQYSQENTCA